MSREVSVYQTWHGEDMALSDCWHPTLKEARSFIASNYGVAASSVTLDKDGHWDGNADDGFDIHCSRYRVEMTKDGICEALTRLPNR